jgi:hypothetical protein
MDGSERGGRNTDHSLTLVATTEPDIARRARNLQVELGEDGGGVGKIVEYGGGITRA